MGAKFESLAANGIIDFDANAYVFGGKHVPAVAEESGLPFDRPLMASPHVPSMLPGASMHKQPHKDQFGHEKKMTNGQALTAVLLSGLAIFGAIKFAPKIKSFFNGISEKIQKRQDKAKKAAKQAKQDAKFAKYIGTPTASSTTGTNASAATNKSKAFFQNMKQKIVNLPRPAKIVGGVALGLIALLGLKKLFTKNETQQH